MAELTNKDIDVAMERGRIAQVVEPRAQSARFDQSTGRIVVELTNGCTFAFPPGLAQGLEDAAAENLSQVEILGAGYGLHWDVLDVDLSVPGLLCGLFGSAAYMVRRAGQGQSAGEATAAAGAKGGQPRKIAGL